MIYKTEDGTLIDEGSAEATGDAVKALVDAGYIVVAEIEPSDTVLPATPPSPFISQYYPNGNNVVNEIVPTTLDGVSVCPVFDNVTPFFVAGGDPGGYTTGGAMAVYLSAAYGCTVTWNNSVQPNPCTFHFDDCSVTPSVIEITS